MKTLGYNDTMQGTQSFHMMTFITKRSKSAVNLDSVPCSQRARYIITV